MEPLSPPNNGSRPSALELDRVITGEISGAEASSARSWLEEHGHDYQQRTDSARRSLPPIDIPTLRQRALDAPRVDDTPAPANSAWVQWVGVLGMAAALLLTALPTLPSPPPTPPLTSGWTAKSGSLSAWSLQDGTLQPYRGEPLGEGDVVGFHVRPGSYRALTLLSVDGNGEVSVFYPESDEQPLAVPSRSEFALPGTIILDAAPGPELVVVVWDTSVQAAELSLRAAYLAGGESGVRRWAGSTAEVDLVTIERK